MNESQIIHPHYELPELFQSRKRFKIMARCYDTIDTYFRSWGKFSKERFVSTGFRDFTPKSWGYHSFDHLFIMRGCVPDGDYYTYDVRTATERKVRILAAHLRKFSCAEFCDKYKKVFTTEEILTRGCGFDSVESLLNSIPELMSTGEDQYEVRRGADLFAWPKNGQEKEVGRTDEGIDRAISIRNSVDMMTKSQGHRCEKLDQSQVVVKGSRSLADIGIYIRSSSEDEEESSGKKKEESRDKRLSGASDSGKVTKEQGEDDRHGENSSARKRKISQAAANPSPISQAMFQQEPLPQEQLLRIANQLQKIVMQLGNSGGAAEQKSIPLNDLESEVKKAEKSDLSNPIPSVLPGFGLPLQPQMAPMVAPLPNNIMDFLGYYMGSALPTALQQGATPLELAKKVLDDVYGNQQKPPPQQ